jgi:hypothetical protein
MMTMADQGIRPDLIEKLQEMARREKRPLDDLVEAMIAEHGPNLSPAEIILAQAKRLVDYERQLADYQLVDQEAILRQDRLHLYELARRYWRNAGDTERATLTEEQLDEQFWLFDSEGIPRLKSEQGTVTLQPNPLLKIAEAAEQEGWHSGETDISERSREILENEFADYLLARLNRPENQHDE